MEMNMGISRNEKAALKAIKRGESIDPEMESILISKGLIARCVGGLSLTSKGKISLSADRGMSL